MKKVIHNTCLATITILFLIANINANGQDSVESSGADKASCGYEVIHYLATTYYPDSTFSLSPVYNKDELTLKEMLDACRTLSSDAQVIQCKEKDLLHLSGPVILHLNFNHYILATKTENGVIHVYDPSAPHIKTVSRSYISQNFSGNAIVFGTSEAPECRRSAEEISKIKGGYMHEYPPPNDNEPGYYRGEDEENVSFDGCSGSYGQPVLSVNPLILNIVASDIPMWYDAGKGPDITLKLVYNGNDKNEISGGLSAPTQYYPVGYGWSFSYAAFYKVQNDGKILINMPDGQRMTFTYSVSSGTFISSLATFYNKLEWYPVSGGYGYSLTLKESKIKYRFDNPLHKKLTSIEDRNGHSVILHYDANFNLNAIEDANGRSVNLVLNSDGRIIKAIDPTGREALFSYGFTDNKFLTGITDMGGFTSAIEYANVPIIYQSGAVSETRIVSVTTPNGNSSIGYTTGSVGPGLLGCTFTYTNPSQESSKVEYYWGNASQGKTRIYDKKGAYYDYFLDLTSSRITNVIYPEMNASVYYTYDNNGNKTSVIKGTWETLFEYDSRGNVTSVTDPRGKVTHFTFYSNDNLHTILDPMSRLTTYNYDANSNLTSIIAPAGTKSYTYNTSHMLATSTNPNGHTTNYSYDTYGYLSTIQPPSGEQITFIKDAAGRITTKISNGISINYTYDNLNQLTQTTFPDGTTILNTYVFKNLVQKTDRGGRIYSYVYDCGDNCRIKNSISPQGTIHYQRDGNGNILGININGQSTHYQYDGLDRMIKQINPDGTFREYTYDELGNISTRTDENGLLTTYTYDYNLLTDTDYSDDTPDVSYTYNNSGEVTSMTDGTGTTTYNYDSGGRLAGKDGPENDDNIAYTYDNNGNRTAMSLPGMNLTYSYSNLDQLINVTNTTISASAQYNYNPKQLLTAKTYSNGSNTNYAYDNLNRLVSLENKKSNGQMISGFTYAYDNTSMITKITDNDGNISNYEYDYAYQLVRDQVLAPEGKTWWDDQFAYDNMGNRITLNKNGTLDNYNYNISNQLLSMTKTSVNASGIIHGDSLAEVFVEDIKATTKYLGNNKTEFKVSDVPLFFESDSLQVAAIVNEDFAAVGDSAKFISGAGQSPDHTVNIYFTKDLTGANPSSINTLHLTKDTIRYSYDNNGNLTHRISSGDTTVYRYDAENRLKEITFPDGVTEQYIYDGLGQRVKTMINGIVYSRYIFDKLFEPVVVKNTIHGKTEYFTRGLDLGGGIGGLIVRNDNNQNKFLFFYNHRGDLTDLTNFNDSVNLSLEYKAFGEIADTSGSFLSDFLFCSKEFNSKSGLSNFGFRFYSDEMNRWISKDPIGFIGGYNNFCFVNNNPIRGIDPFGLWTCNPYEAYVRGKEIGKEVSNEAESKYNYPTSTHNNEADAWRHAEWSRRMSDELGSFWSETIGWGHELMGALNGQPFSEFAMDIYNNQMGIEASVTGNTSVDPNALLWYDELNYE